MVVATVALLAERKVTLSVVHSGAFSEPSWVAETVGLMACEPAAEMEILMVDATADEKVSWKVDLLV